MPDLGMTHIGLCSSQLDKSIVFYRRFARMEVVHRRRGVAWLSDRTRPFAIVLIETEDFEPLSGWNHLGVACTTRAEVDALSALAEQEGRLLRGPTDSGPPVGYWSFIRDPDGHTLEVSFGQDVGLAIVDSRIDSGQPQPIGR